MNILSPNLRGRGDKAKHRRLASLICSGKFDFICLQETKREVLDHCTIWLVRSVKDWGPKSLRFINGWLEHDERHRRLDK